MSDWDWYFREQQAADRRRPQRFTCSDCRQSFAEGATGVPTTGKVFCQDCKHRRGLEYLFDGRAWTEIEAAKQKGAA